MRSRFLVVMAVVALVPLGTTYAAASTTVLHRSGALGESLWYDAGGGEHYDAIGADVYSDRVTVSANGYVSHVVACPDGTSGNEFETYAADGTGTATIARSLASATVDAVLDLTWQHIPACGGETPEPVVVPTPVHLELAAIAPALRTLEVRYNREPSTSQEFAHYRQVIRSAAGSMTIGDSTLATTSASIQRDSGPSHAAGVPVDALGSFDPLRPITALAAEPTAPEHTRDAGRLTNGYYVYDAPDWPGVGGLLSESIRVQGERPQQGAVTVYGLRQTSTVIACGDGFATLDTYWQANGPGTVTIGGHLASGHVAATFPTSEVVTYDACTDTATTTSSGPLSVSVDEHATTRAVRTGSVWMYLNPSLQRERETNQSVYRMGEGSLTFDTFSSPTDVAGASTWRYLRNASGPAVG